jgi:hypothetical protein
MSEKTEAVAVPRTHVEDVNQLSQTPFSRTSEVAHAKVQSVALADALAKDNPLTWSASMWSLYLIMFFVTLSQFLPWNLT